jgi:hypothetical protein
MEDEYHFDDLDNKPFMMRNFRFVEYRHEGTNAKDLVMQDGTKKICYISDSAEDETHNFEIFGFHPRIKDLVAAPKTTPIKGLLVSPKTTPIKGLLVSPKTTPIKGRVAAPKTTAELKFGVPVHKWAMLRDRSWKDDIEQREIAMWNGKEYEPKYVIRNLGLSKHHLAIHKVGEENVLVAVLFRRDYSDGTERHKWVVSLAPGVDPCFMMCVSACLDKLIAH